MVRTPSPLKADRLSHAFCGTVSVTVYPASDVFALANGCADAGPAVTQNAMNVIAYARMNISTFQKTIRPRPPHSPYPAHAPFDPAFLDTSWRYCHRPCCFSAYSDDRSQRQPFAGVTRQNDEI